MVLHPFLESFRKEHAENFEALKRLKLAGDWTGFYRYCRQEVLETNEKREELFLFPAIAAKAEIRAGGPACMLYYDLHLSEAPLLNAAMACDEPPLVPSKIANAIRKPFYDAGSPVCIPIEDHMALEQILNRAERESDPAQLDFLSAIYMRIFRSHIEKEDNCLLLMSQSLLDTAEWDSWAQKSNEWQALRSLK